MVPCKNFPHDIKNLVKPQKKKNSLFTYLAKKQDRLLKFVLQKTGLYQLQRAAVDAHHAMAALAVSNRCRCFLNNNFSKLDKEHTTFICINGIHPARICTTREYSRSLLWLHKARWHYIRARPEGPCCRDIRRDLSLWVSAYHLRRSIYDENGLDA